MPRSNPVAASGMIQNCLSLWTKQSTGTATALPTKENFLGNLLGLSPTPQYPGRNTVPMPALLQLEIPCL